MITASIYGRLGRDPETRYTQAGKAMVTGSLAVNVAGARAESEDVEWIRLLAFGQAAEALARHEKGDSIGAIGRLERQRWTNRDGEERTSWQVVVDALHSSRTVRPGGGRKRQAEGSEPRQAAPQRRAAPAEAVDPEFDDAVPF